MKRGLIRLLMVAGFTVTAYGELNPATGEPVGGTVCYGPSATAIGVSTSVSITGAIEIWGK